MQTFERRCRCRESNVVTNVAHPDPDCPHFFRPDAEPRYTAAEVRALVDFAKWAISGGPWEGNDLDGGEVQDKAKELGLIVGVTATEACDEDGFCNCAGWDDFPQTCYRFAPWLAPTQEGQPHE